MTPDKVLEGHSNAKEILEVLGWPTEHYDSPDRKEGFLWGQMDEYQKEDNDSFMDLKGLSDACSVSPHTLEHWKGGFDLGAFEAHQSRTKRTRANHGLEFLQRPHRKGVFSRLGRKTKDKVNKQYREQLLREQQS